MERRDAEDKSDMCGGKEKRPYRFGMGKGAIS